MMYNPSVASSEMTMLRKIESVKSEFGVRGPLSLMTFLIPLNARKNAAICAFHKQHIARISILCGAREFGGTHIPSCKS